jgi:hypothetical protein
MNITQEQFDRLPKNVQQELKSLYEKVNSLENHVNEINGQKDTNVFLLEGLSKRPLPKDSHIELFDDNQNSISVCLREEGIYLNAHSPLGLALSILPRACNAFLIRFI